MVAVKMLGEFFFISFFGRGGLKCNLGLLGIAPNYSFSFGINLNVTYCQIQCIKNT